MTRYPRFSRKGLTLLIAAPFIVVACSSAASVDTAAVPDPAARPDAAPTATQEPETAPVAAADIWRDIELTDVATGETFTLASLEGNLVAIEPMAVWCTSCRTQADNVKAALPDLEPSGVRWVSLGVEPNESADSLANYRERFGYEWTFAQSPIEMSRALRDIFGPQILAVPATPLIVLDENGEIVFNDVGIHGPEALVDIIAEAAA